MAKFKMDVTINPFHIHKTARVQDGASGVNPLTRMDNGKFVKLIGDSQYGLCAVGNEIEGLLAVADDIAPHEGFNLGSVKDELGTRVQVIFDGLQASPGTGVIAIGDFVVCGTQTARGVELPAGGPRVCKATAAATGLVYKWRVMSFKSGNGAVGQTGIIERVA